MLNLNSVIISSCVYGKNEKYILETISSIEKCIKVANFKEIRLFHTFSEKIIDKYKKEYTYINFKQIDYFNNRKQYAYWLMNKQGLEYKDYLDTDHILIIQNDSWIVNPDSWTDEFLKYDYIGAVFPCRKKEIQGNGGFSLRSIKLIKYLSTLPKEIKSPYMEDYSICIYNRKFLESLGFKFAPLELAKKFSVEGRPITNQFGHHCSNNIKILKNGKSVLYINYDKVFQKNPLKFFRTKKYLYLYDKEKDC
jgi:hypothetical protein